ncbi:MAG: hypothetical protein R3A47_12355 [Polyangiales bacterium]
MVQDILDFKAGPSEPPASDSGWAGHPAIAAWVFDSLSYQAEHRLQSVNENALVDFATALQLDWEGLNARFSTLVLALREGATSTDDARNIAHLAVVGFRDRLAYSFDRKSLLERFVDHADWLVIATPYDPYEWVDSVFDEREAREFFDTVGDRVLSEQDGTPAVRALAAARITSLCRSRSQRAIEIRERIARESRDPVVRAMAVASDEEKRESIRGPITVRGTAVRAVAVGWRRTLQWITGYALLMGCLDLVKYLLRYRRQTSIELGEQSLRVRSTQYALGRTLWERERLISVATIRSVQRTARYQGLYGWIGTILFSVGFLFGIFKVFEGVRSGEVVLVTIGVAFALGGALMDMIVWWFASKQGHSCTLTIDIEGTHKLAIRGLQSAEADLFMDHMNRRIAFWVRKQARASQAAVAA